MDENAAGLDQIREILPEMPAPDLEAGTAALTAERRHAGRAGGLGTLGEAAAWLATWQGRCPPRLGHPRIAIFAGGHGVAAMAFPDRAPGETARAVEAMVEGRSPLNRLCRLADTDLRVYEMAIDQPTADFAAGPAMTEEECARAIAYGMMAVEQGVDLIAVAAPGEGVEASAAALCRALAGAGGTPAWQGDLPATARDVVDAGVARHGDGSADAFELLRRLGGPDIAAAVGTLIAARMARVPALIEGPGAIAAAAILQAATPNGIAHCAVADRRHGADLPGALQLGLTIGAPAGLALATAIPFLRGAALLYGEG